MKSKVIHIMANPPAYDLYIDYPRPKINWDTSTGTWVGIWGYDWANQIAKNVIELSPDILFEVWQPDFRADRIYQHKFDDGQIHKLFPAVNKGGQVYSANLIKELEKEIDTNLIVQIGGMPILMNRLLTSKFSDKVPIINMFFGNLQFTKLKFGKNFMKWSNTYKKWKEIKEHIRKQRYISIGPHLPREHDFRHNYLSSANMLLNHSIGIDEKFFDNKYDKEKIRKKLELPNDKFVFLSSSRLNGLKQVDKLIKVMGSLKKNNFILLITGAGSEKYKAYLNKLIDNQPNDIRLLNYLSEEELIMHYKASDYFIDVSLNDGGPMSAWKALALGIPVITTATGNVGAFLKKHNGGHFLPRKKYSEWVSLFYKILNNNFEASRVELDAVKEVVSWPSCAKRLINNYVLVLEDFNKKDE